MFTVRVVQCDDVLAIPTRNRNVAMFLAEHFMYDYIVEVWCKPDDEANEVMLAHYEP